MTRIKRHTTRVALIGMLLLPLVFGVTLAQSAADAGIESPVIASGGGEMLGTGQEEISGTIGQPITTIDTLQGAEEETVWIGFWAVLPSDPLSIREERLVRTVRSTRIGSIAPNPFADAITFEIDLAESAHVALAICDPLGREMIRLVDGQRATGAHRLTWRAVDLPAGVYFVRLEINGTTHSASPIQHYK